MTGQCRLLKHVNHSCFEVKCSSRSPWSLLHCLGYLWKWHSFFLFIWWRMLVFSCFLFCLPVFPIAVFGQCRCDRDAKSLFLTPRPGTLFNRVLGTQASERLDLCLQCPKFSWPIPTVLPHAQILKIFRRFSALLGFIFSALYSGISEKRSSCEKSDMNFRFTEYNLLWGFSGFTAFAVGANWTVFLVGAFLEKKIDYSHGFSSVFFLFFRYTLSGQNSSTPEVLPNFRKTPKCTRWPKELNQEGFPRNIQYRTRPNDPLFSFLWHCETFFTIFFHWRVSDSPIHFEVLLLFLSLRHVAELGRSRLDNFQFGLHLLNFGDHFSGSLQ